MVWRSKKESGLLPTPSHMSVALCRGWVRQRGQCALFTSPFAVSSSTAEEAKETENDHWHSQTSAAGFGCVKHSPITLFVFITCLLIVFKCDNSKCHKNKMFY